MKKLLMLLSVVALTTATRTVSAQGTAFSYQGRLENNGAPANGNYDLVFALYTTNSGGVAIAGPVTDSATAVSNGLFTVTIDFGTGVFTGNNFWLDVSVSPAGSNAFTELTPRQPILPTPYATMANTASNLLGELPASQLTGPIAMAQLSSAIVTNTESGVTLNGTFSGNGSGLTALNPVNLTGGTAAINISGNAATATSATTAASASTANSATTAATANNFSGSLSGDVTGTQNATVVASVGGVSAAHVASGANAANAATSADTTGAIVQRDASGNFSAGTITANLAGNATTATTATTALNFTGNVVDSQLPANVPTLNGTNAFSGTNNFTGVLIATNTGNVLVGTFSGVGSGLTALNPANLTAGTAGINISGNAATATTASTANSATTAISATSAATAGTAAVASNVASGISITNAFITNSVFAGNGSALTGLNPASLSSGTAGINISGNAATATTASTANSATTAATATIAATATTAALASNLVSGASISSAFVTNSTFAGNGAGLTNLNASQLYGSVPGASLTSVPAGNLTGTVPLGQLPSAVLTNNETGVTLSGNFSGSFSGMTNLTAASISTNLSASGQVLTSSGGVTTWANANPWLGNIPTLVTNGTLSTNAFLTGKDRAFFLGFITSAGTQKAYTNYFTIKLSQAVSTNAVMATFSPASRGGWTNTTTLIEGYPDFFQAFQLVTTSNSITVQSIVAPPSSTSYGFVVHVDQY